jgi:hypothetical protein
VRGAAYCGYGAAKQESFFGWRLHLVCTSEGLPVRYSLLPAAYHDLTPIHELLWELPAGVWVVGDKAYNSAADEENLRQETGVVLVPIGRTSMTPNSWSERACLAEYRHSVETVNSQAEKMGLEHLQTRTTPGLEIKVAARVVALAFRNLHKLSDDATGCRSCGWPKGDDHN